MMTDRKDAKVPSSLSLGDALRVPKMGCPVAARSGVDRLEHIRVISTRHRGFHALLDISRHPVRHHSIHRCLQQHRLRGLTTGTFFRGLMTQHVTSRAADNLNEDVRTTDIIRFVATGSRDAYSLMVSSRFVVNQGDYVLTEQTWTEVCR